LLNPAQFSRVLNGRCKVANESFTVYALTNECSHPRLGLVVGKKAARKAVDRNRIKRIIREVFRSNAASYATLDVVVIANWRLVPTSDKTAVSIRPVPVTPTKP
jgi:ribonuclease P protein component